MEPVHLRRDVLPNQKSLLWQGRFQGRFIERGIILGEYKPMLETINVERVSNSEEIVHTNDSEIVWSRLYRV